MKSSDIDIGVVEIRAINKGEATGEVETRMMEQKRGHILRESEKKVKVFSVTTKYKDRPVTELYSVTRNYDRLDEVLDSNGYAMDYFLCHLKSALEQGQISRVKYRAARNFKVVFINSMHNAISDAEFDDFISDDPMRHTFYGNIARMLAYDAYDDKGRRIVDVLAAEKRRAIMRRRTAAIRKLYYVHRINIFLSTQDYVRAGSPMVRILFYDKAGRLIMTSHTHNLTADEVKKLDITSSDGFWYDVFDLDKMADIAVTDMRTDDNNPDFPSTVLSNIIMSKRGLVYTFLGDSDNDMSCLPLSHFTPDGTEITHAWNLRSNTADDVFNHYTAAFNAFMHSFFDMLTAATAKEEERIKRDEAEEKKYKKLHL